MQQTYRGTPMSNCEFNILHFGLGALLYIKFTACIFSEIIFLRTPLDACFWYRLCCTLSSCITPTSLVNLHIVETKWEVKNFRKNFHDVLEKGARGRNKTCYTLPWRNWITSGPWKGIGKTMGRPYYMLFFKLVTTFGHEEIGSQKIKKQLFSNIYFIP